MCNRIGSRVSEWVCRKLLQAQSEWRRLEARARDESGAITIEYILIIALIAIIIITLFTVLLWPLLRPAIVNLVNTITNAISGGDIS